MLRTWISSLSALSLACIVLAFCVVPASSKPAPGDDPLAQDARAYARQIGVSPNEAIRRLNLQDDAGELDAALTRETPDGYAGLFIRHEPSFRIVVRFKGRAPAGLADRVEGGPLAGLVETARASASLAELRRAQAGARSSGRGSRSESWIDVPANRVVVRALDADQARSRSGSATPDLSDEVVIREADELSAPEAPLYGGLGIYNTPSAGPEFCTSGLAVRQGKGALGVITAAHCDDGLYRDGRALPYRTGRYGGSYDVQFHASPSGVPVRPWMRDGYGSGATPFYRRVTGTRHRLNQPVGSFVCKHGQATGTTCGTISSNYFTPPSTSVAFSSTFVQVRSQSVDLSAPGDSGAPWFTGTTALGVHRCGLDSGGAYTACYMPVNYVGDLNLRVLRVKPRR